MTTKISDLPEFSSILDAHENVAGALDDYTGDDEDMSGIAEFEGPSARNWVDGLSSAWAGDLRGAPYVAPLAEIVRRIGGLSGVPLPEIDDSESDNASVMMTEGYDGDG